MSEEATLVELLRSTELTNGSISLRRVQGGEWSAVIVHHRETPDHTLEHMIHPLDRKSCDPVEALRAALIEDDRVCRDLRRRYRAAPKCVAAPAPDFDAEDCLG